MSTETIDYALDDNPSDFADNINKMLLAKVGDAIASRKQDIAQTMFASDEGDEIEIEDEDEDYEDEDV